MKLELKYLAPYLPYGLKINDHRCEMDFIMHPIGGTGFIGIMEVIRSESYKPILNPMWSLNLTKLQSIQGRNLDISLDSCLEWYIEDSEAYYPSGIYNIPKDIWLGNYEYLVQNHFDIFGLIEQGLAIDITALES